MQAFTTAPIAGAPSYAEKARRHKDGSVVLSVADDRICKLNGVGALTWMILEENPAGLSVDGLVSELSELFDAINAEGQLLYEVPREQLRHDTSRFLAKLAELNLLGVHNNSGGQDSYCIKEGVSGTTSTTVAAKTATPLSRTGDHRSAGSEIRLLKRETLTAFIGLLAFDLVLKFGGFQSVIKKVEHWPTAEPRRTDLEVCRRVRAMVDRAQVYYPKKAMCLQHSAVVTCLLRRRGFPAEMVLAAQEFPPKAHAWSEVNGEVVNDSQRVKTRFLELRRV
jgi:hypothetical protein